MSSKKDPKPKAEPKRAPRPGEGRPTIYKEEFCQKLIDHMSSGLSFESFGATINVARDRVYEWAKKHEEFAEAKSKALDLNLLWWERQGSMGLWTDREGPQLNNTIWVFSMKNRHNWRDNKDMVVQKDVTINHIRDELKQKSTEELLAIMKEAKKE